MSLRVLSVLASLAACADTGAHLTLIAPDGPSNAETFVVVLATPEQVPEIRNQRVAPYDRTTVDVHYFLQRTIAGADTDNIDEVDGFTVRIAPDPTINETQFIPFVVLYDHDKHITGIGTYRAGEENLPAPILVMRDEIDKYKLHVEKTNEIVDDTVELAPGDLRVVTCYREDQTPFTSGVVWHTLDGAEYRLLFPSDDGDDATGRTLDMDCDDHEVTVDSSYRDCDDTRSEFHRDAADVCDGKDTNCDGSQVVTTTCDAGIDCQTPFAPTTADGVVLCNDAGDTRQMTNCTATATCACNNSAGGCHFCQVPLEKSLIAPTSGAVHPCQPAVGTLQLQYCTTANKCDVEVLAVRGDWKVKVSSPAANAFGSRAYDITGALAIKAERPEGTAYELTAQTNSPVADVDLALIMDNATIYLPLQLRLDEVVLTACPMAPALTCY